MTIRWSSHQAAGDIWRNFDAIMQFIPEEGIKLMNGALLLETFTCPWLVHWIRSVLVVRMGLRACKWH